MPAIILTGASRGIGLAIAKILLSKNQKVLGVSRSEGPLKELKEAHPGQFDYICGDITASSTSDKAIEAAKKLGNGISGIVLNAGILEPVAKVADANIADWRNIYEVNVFAVVDLVSKAVPELRKTHGKCVFVSSGASTGNYVGWAAYGSTKAALNHFAASLAVEEPDIFSVSIAPGVVDTQMQVNIREEHSKGMDPAVHQSFVDRHSNKELLAPETPGTVIANLAIEGGSKDIDGKYLRWNDEVLAKYQ